MIDLSRLPSPNVIQDLNYETIRAEMIADLKTRLPEWNADLESDPAVKILEVAAYRELLLRQRVNDAAKAVMLAYAVENDLDNLGAPFDVERLPEEDDGRFRGRIQQGLHLLASAGPEMAYRQHAMGVDSIIRDVCVSNQSPGVVTVAVLAPFYSSDAEEIDLIYGRAAFPDLAEGDPMIAPADAPVMDAVRVQLNDQYVRPLTDQVEVRSPGVVPFEISAEITLYPGPDEDLIVEEIRASLEKYLAEVRRINYDVTRAGIVDALVVPGVQNVTLSSPESDIVCGPTDLALCLESTITLALEREI